MGQHGCTPPYCHCGAQASSTFLNIPECKSHGMCRLQGQAQWEKDPLPQGEAENNLNNNTVQHKENCVLSV